MSSGPHPERVPDAGRDGASDTGAGGVVAPSGGTDAAGAVSALPHGARPASPAGLVFDDPLDRPSADDTDRGWGDMSSGMVDDDFTRFLNEKPPHHL